MKRIICDVIVTACRFDQGCRSVPTRIDWRGRSYSVSGEHGRYHFDHQGRYYWLTRGKGGWKIMANI